MEITRTEMERANSFKGKKCDDEYVAMKLDWEVDRSILSNVAFFPTFLGGNFSVQA